jgi:putative aldouronate transport system substrate-binding protein
MKRLVSLVLALTLAGAVCALFASGTTEAPAAAAEKPVIKVLTWFHAFDPNKDFSALRTMKLTGYTVDYHILPSTNADEKLMMEMAAGADYDLLLRLSINQFGKLSSSGALLALDDKMKLIPNVTVFMPKLAWDTARGADGKVYGIPHITGKNATDPYGTRNQGLATKQEILKELGLSIPTTRDEFLAFLRAIKKAKNVAPITATAGGIWLDDVLSSFGMYNLAYTIIDGKFVPRAKNPNMRAYVRFMAQLYQEGLIDKDLPINKSENTDAKFTSSGAYLVQMAFWDIPRLVPALEKNGLSKELAMFDAPLKDGSGIYHVYANVGVDRYEAIPRSAKHPDAALDYTNVRSDPAIFIKTHIGDEGVHYEVRNGRYFPIYPASNDLMWANQFTGFAPAATEFAQWQARARKTPEMAVAYERINGKLVKDGMYVDVSTFANAVPALQKYSMSLAKLENDSILKAIVDNRTSDADFDAFLKQWEAEGGAEVVAAMNKWLADNKDAVNALMK